MDSGKKINLPAEIAGWYGIGAIILAYGLVSFNLVEADSLFYQILNLTGAAGVIAISWIKGVRQPLVLNIILGGNHGRGHCCVDCLV